MVTREQLGEFKDAAVQQFQEANWIGKLAVAGAVATLSAEWLFNEAIVGTAGSQALAHTHDALRTMVTAGATSTIEQVIFGTSAAFAVSQVPRLMEKARETFYKPPEAKPDEALVPGPSLSFAAQAVHKFKRGAGTVAEAFALGVALPLFAHNAKETRNFGSNMGNVGRNSVIIGLGNFMLAGMVVGILDLGEAIGAQGPANVAVAIMSFPLTWVAAFGVIRGRDVIAQTASNLTSKLQHPPIAS